MTNTANTQSTAPIIDRAEATRVLSLVKHEIAEVIADANRKRPFYAPSVREAEAKAKAALKALDEFAANLNKIKMTA